MDQLIQGTLPAALKALLDSHNSIAQIADYCKRAYTADDPNKIFEQTQKYTKEALANVAYHVHAVSTHMTNLLELQANELEKLDVQLRTITDVCYHSID